MGSGTRWIASVASIPGGGAAPLDLQRPRPVVIFPFATREVGEVGEVHASLQRRKNLAHYSSRGEARNAIRLFAWLSAARSCNPSHQLLLEQVEETQSHTSSEELVKAQTVSAAGPERPAKNGPLPPVRTIVQSLNTHARSIPYSCREMAGTRQQKDRSHAAPLACTPKRRNLKTYMNC
ncbi:hypothetical protein BDK51DRAFT_34200 [Blyttiomyces helicus]|uniref:Uncharacterized protein n=1 Tax=Blyttiomyces helicus TaxID=388810 RepID=A0A4P9VXP5_9FUNG|nr:hypothetical protein BDK51DRAFT_34200 [Blyttiomyces helicus]|eukprot:RKO83483.1 hypothetical protein BDK51DRAFT_34200 [Blyttiomyces helicus]